MEQAQTSAHGADEALAARARAGDRNAADELVRRFERLATGIASRYYLQGGDRDDLNQEARLGVFKATRDYNPAAGSSFGAFARLCVERQVITALKTANRKKHQALTFAGRTTKADNGETDGDVFDAADVIVAANADAHELLADHDRAMLVMAVIRDQLSDLERACIVGYANGESYVDIALRLGFPVRPIGERRKQARSKVVDNALERARLKIRLALAVEDERLPLLGAAA